MSAKVIALLDEARSNHRKAALCLALAATSGDEVQIVAATDAHEQAAVILVSAILQRMVAKEGA